jgi:DUF971 family protein
MRPVQIKQISLTELRLKWDDGVESTFTTEHLRRKCPCAVCTHEAETNKKEGRHPIMLASQIQVQKLELSGHNAMIIIWGDGHRTGIYTWEYLREISP